MLKLLLLPCLAFFCYGAVNAQSKIVVRIASFETNKGTCLVCLYDNPASFAGKGNPVQCLGVGIDNKSAEAVFNEVPAGTYAISVIHDANKNNRFDKNIFGIPSEGYGASQNKLPFAAAPKFEENKFTSAANATTTVSIKLRYLL